MKNINKILCSFIVLCIFFVNKNVYAIDYSVKQLIPVTEEATVYTETFIYNGIKFAPDSNNKANGVLKFSAITNNKSVSKPVSFNILLFDGGQKNIGFISYCADRDYDNNFDPVKGNGSIPFQINVTSRYFGGREENYNGIVREPGEILYYAFIDDNSYCQIGGYTKYIGKTLEEINNGEVNFDNENIKEKLRADKLILYLPYFLIGLVALIGYGLLLNSLYKRMHARTSILSYLPMTNLYIAVKLAFGKGLAWVFYILCVGSFIFAFTSSTLTLAYVGIAFVAVATFLDVIKLITGKYNMFIIGKKQFDEESLDNSFSSHSGSRFIDDGEEEPAEKPVTADDILNSIDNAKNNNNNDNNDNNTLEEDSNVNSDVVDISYDSDMPIAEGDFSPLSSSNDSFTTFNDVNNFNDMSHGIPQNNVLTPVSNIGNSLMDLDDDDDMGLNNKKENKETTSVPRLGEDEINKDGESELSNFFR